MNKIITTLILAGIVLACKPKSEDIKPVVEIACKQLSYKRFGSDNILDQSDTYIYDQMGNLIEFQTYIYDQMGNLIAFPGLINNTKYEYNTKGNILKTTQYTKYQIEVVKSSETVYTYNAADQPIMRVINMFDNSGRLYKETEILYEYHANGKIKKISTFSWPFTIPESIVEYNEKGNKISTQFRSGNYEKLEYNTVDLIVKETTYYFNLNQTTERFFEYNSKNLKVKISTIINALLDIYFTYEYNAKGQLITQIQYNRDGIISRWITDYTGENYKFSHYNDQNMLISYETNEVQNGLLMKKSYYEDNKLVNYEINTYDNHKNSIKSERFNGNSVMIWHSEWTYQCN